METTENITYKNNKDIENMSEEEKYRFSSQVFYNSMQKEYIRKFIFKLFYKDSTKAEIKDAVEHWSEMSENERFTWIHDNLGKLENFNEFVDLVQILKYEKNPKKALDIWKSWQNNKRRLNKNEI